VRCKFTIKHLLLFLFLVVNAQTGHSASGPALVILVNFQDAISSISRQEYDDLFNAEAYQKPNASVSVHKYVEEVSQGTQSYQFTVTDWITLPNQVDYYTNLGFDGPIELVKDAIAVLDQQGFDFNPYDGDGDGWADLIGIVHRGSNSTYGTGPANTPDWSTVPNLLPPIAVDAIQIRRAWMITDSNPAFETITTVGGIIHEMVGHAVCNLPDLYNWVAGSWGQVYGGNVFNPTHISAFAKQHCGWIEVLDIETAGSLQIRPVQESGIAYRLWIDPLRESEYFLLEYRDSTGLDQNLPGTGLLIWHVDLSADQDNFLYLEQADGNNDLADTFGFGAADESDPFPGSTGNQFFNENSTPDSDAREGGSTGIRIDNIILDTQENVIRVDVTPSPHLTAMTLVYDETYIPWAWSWQPSGGHKEDEHVAVRFTAVRGGNLQRIKLMYWGPDPTEASPKPFEIKIYDDFESGNILPESPLRILAEQVFGMDGENNWYDVELTSTLPLSAGESFIIDLKWTEPVITIDYPGMNDSRSFYKPPGTDSYTPIPHDLRLRAVITGSTTGDVAIAGDLNDNGAIDLGDPLIALKIVAGIAPLSSPNPGHDINDDQKIGLAEAIFILNLLADLRGNILINP